MPPAQSGELGGLVWGAPLLRAPQPSRGDVFTKGKNSKEILFGLVCFFLKTLEPLTITVL